MDYTDTAPVVDSPELRSSAMGLLVASLEELKVAEEELQEVNARLNAHRQITENETQHYRRLFLCAPYPAFITDTRATVLEVNYQAAAFFGHETQYLERKPLAVLVAEQNRHEFRREFSRLSPDRPISDWNITFRRTRNVPVTMSAAVSIVRDPGGSRADLLFWALREILAGS
ncbi:MAG TPA: PAS domain-containing protein [Gemmatimonadaceae bacterium]